MPKKKRELTDDDFDARYEVIQNHIDPNASFSGAFFETYGAEQDFIYSIAPERVWTVVDVDGELWIIAGRHYVNRFGYLVTTKDWSDPFEEYRIDQSE